MTTVSPTPHTPLPSVCPKTHTGVEETEEDRDVMDALIGGDTILWGRRLGEGKPFQTKVTT